MSVQKNVLVVGGFDFMLDQIEQAGVRYSVLQLPELITQRQSSSAKQLAAIDYRDDAQSTQTARAWHAVDPFDAVVSFTEYGLEPASRLARHLGVAGDNLDAVLATRDKVMTRELLDRHGLSPVRHRLCAELDDAMEFVGQIGGPIVLKPTDRGLSEGVVRVDDATELPDGWMIAQAAGTGPVLAEELLVGPEYSVESLSVAGVHTIVMVTEKLITPPPRFIELGHQMPARLNAEAWSQTSELATALLSAVGQNTGPAHTEVCLTAAGPRIIECNTRAGGDQIWEMCQIITGINLIAETVAALIGTAPPRREPQARAAAIRFFGYENRRVRAVDGVAATGHEPNVYRVVCSLEAGQELGVLASSDSRQGYVMCTGEDTDEAVAHAVAAHDRVVVAWAPVGADAG